MRSNPAFGTPDFLFPGFWNGFGGFFKANFGVRAVAKRFFGTGAASANRKSIGIGRRDDRAIAIEQLQFARFKHLTRALNAERAIFGDNKFDFGFHKWV